IGAEFFAHPFDCSFRDARKRSAPTCMDSRCGATDGVGNKYRQTVCGLNAEKNIRPVCKKSVATYAPVAGLVSARHDMTFSRMDLMGGYYFIMRSIGIAQSYGGEKSPSVFTHIFGRISRKETQVESVCGKAAHAAETRAECGDESGFRQRRALNYFDAVSLFCSKMAH